MVVRAPLGRPFKGKSALGRWPTVKLTHHRSIDLHPFLHADSQPDRSAGGTKTTPAAPLRTSIGARPEATRAGVALAQPAMDIAAGRFPGKARDLHPRDNRALCRAPKRAANTAPAAASGNA